jgi:hypothetical protein
VTSKHLEELLQQCIAAFDAGTSPEECLDAFPAQRAELEPLFRQAISLRVAFAASPRAEFRQRTRERVLFMAGRDVSAALSARPDPEFIKDARQRFIHAAGAEAQEALRAVPPPRMPFWANTRRHLLERAAEPQRAPRTSRPAFGVPALRAGLSMAVVALVMAIGAFVYSIGTDETPTTTNAQLAQLEQDLADLQRAHDEHRIIDTEKLTNVTAQVNMIVQQPQQSAAVVEKLPSLISKQQQVVQAAANEGLLAPEVAAAQTQQLQAAQEKAELRLAAARAEDPTATPQPAAPTNTAVSAAAVLTPIPTSTPTPVVTPPAADEPVTDGQIRVLRSADNTSNKLWKTIELATMSFNVPDSWTIQGGLVLDGGSYGFGVIDLENLNLKTDDGSTVQIRIDNGRIDVFLANGTQLTLRVGGIDGKFISLDDLTAKAGSLVLDLWHINETFEPAGSLIPPPPTPTPSPTATPTNTATPPPTATPPAASSPAPAATP